MKYHDTHFHLDLVDSPEEIALQIENAKVYTIAVTNTPSVFFFTKKLAANKKFLRPALGLHPELAAERKNELSQFFELMPQTRYIGEVGLDNYNKTPANYQIQKLVFEKIVSACSEVKDKILTIHSRRAAADTLSILGDDFKGKVVLHWYSDTLKQLDIAISRGYYFSINYPMLLSANGKKIIDRIPVEQMLIETDGPFTTFNSKAFTPLLAEIVLNELTAYRSQERGSTEFKNIILNNFKSLLM